MQRLFVGLELPEDVRTRLALVRGPLPGARWIDEDDLHLTLRFAGDIDNRTGDELASFLSAIEIDPFEVRITELGAFGGRDPRTIHAVADGGLALEHLQKAVERAARSAGLPPEPRAFSPHITLARLRGTTPEVVARFLGSRGRFVPMTFEVDRFVLFSSRPRHGGGPYVIEEAFGLGPYSGAGWQPAD
ncbi:MAG: RNA 2',3'-cyclic phosphodiesterase [Hyphomicrobiaceae bacterium]